jgi:plastocyanin
MGPLKKQDPHAAVEIVQGKQGAEFSPATLTIPVGTIVIWTNRTPDVQVFQLGRRMLTLAPMGQDGAVGMTRLGNTGTTSHVLQSAPAAQVTINVQAGN